MNKRQELKDKFGKTWGLLKAYHYSALAAIESGQRYHLESSISCLIRVIGEYLEALEVLSQEYSRKPDRPQQPSVEDVKVQAREVLGRIEKGEFRRTG